MIPPERIERIKREHGLCEDQTIVAINIARAQDELSRRGTRCPSQRCAYRAVVGAGL